MENNVNSKTIVIFGGMGTGKSTLTEYIEEEFERLGFEVYTHNIGDTCRFFSKISRVNATWEGNERTLQQQVASKLRDIDEDILNDVVLADISAIAEISSKTNKRVHIVTGGRTLGDFRYWSEKNTLTVGIISDKNTVSQRLFSRDTGQIQNEKHLSHDTEKDTEHIAKNLCDILVINHGTLSNLKEEATKIAEKYVDDVSTIK